MKFQHVISLMHNTLLAHRIRSWIPILQKEFTKPYFSRLDLFLEKEAATKKIFPPREMVFSAFSACSFDDIKVSLLGISIYGLCSISIYAV